MTTFRTPNGFVIARATTRNRDDGYGYEFHAEIDGEQVVGRVTFQSPPARSTLRAMAGAWLASRKGKP